MRRPKVWEKFYKVVQEIGHEKYGYGEEYYRNGILYDWERQMINEDIAHCLSTCEDYMKNPLSLGFPMKDKEKDLASLYNEVTRSTDRNEIDKLKSEIWELTRSTTREFVNYLHNPTVDIKLAMTILENVKKQADPNNRIVTETKLLPVCDDVYTVFITSDCDGWAEDTNKHIGYTLDNTLSLNGKSESDALNTCGESVELLAKLLKKLDKEGEVNEDNVFVESPLCELIEAMSESLLIKMDGHRNVENERKLKNLIPGLTITAGDQDSFGWLVGCINLENGTVCYG